MRSIVPRVGGKSALAREIINHFPYGYERYLYCEPYFGGGSVLLTKYPSIIEYANDIDADLMNLWLVIKNHCDEFIDALKMEIIHEEVLQEYYNEIRGTEASYPDIERAVKYFMCLKYSFNGFVGHDDSRNRYTMTVAASTVPLRRDNLYHSIRMIADRLQSVRFVCQDAGKFIRRMIAVRSGGNIAGRLFFLDPPYIHTYNDYGPSIWPEVLRQIEMIDEAGYSWVLTIDDCQESRELANDYFFVEASKFYTIHRAHRPELIITNVENSPAMRSMFK